MHRIGDIERFGIWGATFALTLVFLGLAFLTPWAWAGVGIFGALMLLGLHDVIQAKHSILRNYPVAGHMRFFFEGFRVELRQYLLEGHVRLTLLEWGRAVA